jgi:hypothetical protein
MKQIVLGSISIVALTAAMGCGGGGGNVPVKGSGVGVVGGKEVAKEQPGGAPVTKEAADAFTAATLEFKQHEEARTWDDAKCTGVSAKFLAAGAAQGGKFPAAHYNAGITLLRCSREAEAEKEFQIALDEKAALAAASTDPKVKADPVFHQVWVQKAMIRYRKGDVAGINEAIEIIRNKGFDPDALSNVEAFMSLGMLYRERWNKDVKNPERAKKDDFNLEDDLARAQFWLQNALSINDSFMPAYNQLALFYLDKARAVAAKKAKGPKFAAAKGKEQTEAEKQEAKAKSDLQTLELGLLVSEEASRRDPGYAGIWNTQGLILLEMGRTGSATKAFQKATEKDPKFFEAWMNYAAINLQFRGYGEAAKGYESAAALRAKDYDAKLGLAVSLRGQLDQYLTAKQEMERKISECTDPDKAPTPPCQKANAEFPAKIKDFGDKFLDFYKRAGKAYDDAREADGSRIEAYFNKALLVEKYKAKAETTVSTAVAYREAEKLYNEIVTKFGGQEKYAKLVANVKERADEARKSAEFEEKAMAAPPIPPAPSAAPAASAAAATAAPAASGSAAK